MIFFFKQNTAYEMRISDWSSDVCSSDLVAKQIKEGSLDRLRAGEFNIVLGLELARAMGVFVGDKVTMRAPEGQVTPAGVIPRLKQFRSDERRVGKEYVSTCRSRWST